MGINYDHDILQESRRTNRLLSLLIRIVLRLSTRYGLLDAREYLKELND